MKNFLIFKNNILIVLLIFILSLILRLYYFYELDSWFDEWNMFYTVDPSINNNLTWKRFWGDRGDGFLPEYYPPLNAFLLKYFLNFTGYYVEYARAYSLIFGIFSFFLVYKLSNLVGRKNNDYLSIFLFSINLFLIWQSSEIRPHTFVVFFSLLNIIFFILFLNNPPKFLSGSLYIISSIFLLSSWPFTLIIYIGKSAYLISQIKNKKKIFVKFFIIFSFILLLYVIINFNYLIYHLNRDFHYTTLNKSFFYSFHFRSFFGSIFLGGLFLLIFIFYLFKDLKKNLFSDDKLNVLFYIICSSYLLTILYSVFKAGVISPKYIIFILPLIIIWIVKKVETSKFKSYLILLILISSVLNVFFVFFNNPIDRPPFQKVINEISNSDTKEIVMNESIVVNNAYKNYYNFKKNNLTLNKIDTSELPNKFWFICLNNPRFAVGKKILEVDEKCKVFDKDKRYKKLDKLIFKDFYIKKYIFLNK